MQNAWHAITTDFRNTTRDHHGIFDTPNEALAAALDAATDQEVAFALQEDPDFPSGEYAGLPQALVVAQLTMEQVATVQRFCQGCVDDCSVHVNGYYRDHDPVIIRRASWDADAGMWYRRAIRVLPNGESHETSHIVENCVQA